MYGKNIPIYIISFNRLDVLKIMLNRLTQDGYENIHIIDNASTNKDLMEFLKNCPYDVVFMDKNWGHKVFWESGFFDNIIENEYYVVTDPDVLPIEECPSNYIQYFYDILEKYPLKWKVGFSLKIDDIPNSFKYKMEVIRAESFFYDYDRILSKSPLLYDAEIDTTFALYRPGKQHKENFYSAIRTGYPYAARHLPWYTDSDCKTEEDMRYQSTATLCGNTFMLDENVVRYRSTYWLREHEQAIKSCEEKYHSVLEKFIANCKDIYIYGAGIYGEREGRRLEKFGIEYKGFLVTDLPQNKELLDHPVYQFGDFIDKDDGLILAMKMQYKFEVMESLFSRGYTKVWPL